MKNVFIIISVFFLLATETFSMVPEPDIKGSKDHPMLTRMPEFWISGYKDAEFGNYNFIGSDRKPVVIEG